MNENKETEKKKTVREEFAEKFIEILESDKPLEWTKGWSTSGCAFPENGGSNRRYNGVNRLILMIASMEHGWNDNRFYTFKQISDMEGCKVKSGSKATKVEYWIAYDMKEKKSLKLSEYAKLLRENPERKEEEFRLYPKVSYVFNAEQIEGLEPRKVQESYILEPNILAEEVIKVLSENMEVGIVYGGDEAYYSPTNDYIRLPLKESFVSESELYGTTFHEFAHASGAESRLNRPLTSFYADTQSYALEELRAEIASTFMCAEIGIDMPQAVIENHKGYVQSWLSQIKENHNILFSAIKDADRIADYLMDMGRVEILREKLAIAQQMPKGFEDVNYEVWQLKDTPENEPLHFVDFAYASKFRLNESRYEKVYEGIAKEGEDSLDKLYYKFNVSKPDDFRGHSLSVSDVIVLNEEGKRKAWYCDSVGFQEVEGFCVSQKQSAKKGKSR